MPDAPSQPTWHRISTTLGPRLPFLLMLCAVLAPYFPWGSTGDGVCLFGSDFVQLHQRRIAFAQEHLFGPDHRLPAWYPMELCGTPFWSNIQSFPFLPTRLLMIALLDPAIVMAGSTILSALLASAFTYGFARRLGFSRLGSAVSGWTFATGTFFTARIFAGHLPLLEGYPALPLLLYLGERAIQFASDPPRFRSALLLIGLGGGGVMLAGHPQLAIYSLVTVAVYAWVRGGWRLGSILTVVLGSGVGCVSFVLYPMALLTLRSTRILALDPPTNDIPLPYSRFLALFFPGRDGYPALVSAPGEKIFDGFPNLAYFWDTTCYVGWLPWLGLLIVIIAAVARKSPPRPRGFWFVTLWGLVALVTAFPIVQSIAAHLPGTFLRSPARQLYLTTFALALAAAPAVDLLQRMFAKHRRGLSLGSLSIVLGLHAGDLGGQARRFIRWQRPQEVIDPRLAEGIARNLGSQRVAMDFTLPSVWNRQFEDVGFFDSIMLARPYRTLLLLNGTSPSYNRQYLFGSDLRARSLSALGARYVITTKPRPDLSDVAPTLPIHVYEVPAPAPRAAFYPDSAVEWQPVPAIEQRLGMLDRDPWQTLLLPGPTAASPSSTPAAPTAIAYRRVSPDDIVLQLDAPTSGWVRVLESSDPGWSVTIDDQPAGISPAANAFLAVPCPRGRHHIVFHYHTPGAQPGRLLSLLSLATLVSIATFVPRLTASRS